MRPSAPRRDLENGIEEYLSVPERDYGMSLSAYWEQMFARSCPDSITARKRGGSRFAQGIRLRG